MPSWCFWSSRGTPEANQSEKSAALRLKTQRHHTTSLVNRIVYGAARGRGKYCLNGAFGGRGPPIPHLARGRPHARRLGPRLLVRRRVGGEGGDLAWGEGDLGVAAPRPGTTSGTWTEAQAAPDRRTIGHALALLGLRLEGEGQPNHQMVITRAHPRDRPAAPARHQARIGAQRAGGRARRRTPPRSPRHAPRRRRERPAGHGG